MANMYFDKNNKPLQDGDIIDIGQTVNGQNIFIVEKVNPLDIKYYPSMVNYEYNKENLLRMSDFTGEVDYTILTNRKRLMDEHLYNVLSNGIEKLESMKNSDFVLFPDIVGNKCPSCGTVINSSGFGAHHSVDCKFLNHNFYSLLNDRTIEKLKMYMNDLLKIIGVFTSGLQFYVKDGNPNKILLSIENIKQKVKDL